MADTIKCNDYSGYLNDSRFITSSGQRCGCAVTFTISPEARTLSFTPHSNKKEISNYMSGSKANAIVPDDRSYLMKYLVAYNGIDPETYYTGESLIYDYDEFTSNPTYVIQPPPLEGLNAPNLIGIDKDLGRTVVKITHLTGEANINNDINYTVRYNAPLLMRDLLLNSDNTCVYLDGWYSHYGIAVSKYNGTKTYNAGDIAAYQRKDWEDGANYNPGDIIVYDGLLYRANIYIAVSTTPPPDDNVAWQKGRAYANFYIRKEVSDAAKALLPPFFEDSAWSADISFEEWYNWMRNLEYAFNDANKGKWTQGRYIQSQVIITYELENAIRSETQKVCDLCRQDDMFYELSFIEQWLKLRQKRDAICYYFSSCNFKPIQEIIESTRKSCKSCNATLCL